MAALGKDLMDIYYEESREWLSKLESEPDAMEIAAAYSDAESMVNNLMHGRSPVEWIPHFVALMHERAVESRPIIAEHFESIASLAEGALS